MKRTVVKALIGRKLGMTQIFDEGGILKAVTAVEAGPCFIVQKKNKGNDGYDAVQLGFGETKRCNAPQKGHLKAAGHELGYLNEFRLDDVSLFEVGQRLDAGLFEKGEKVDIVGMSKGKGFAGGVKRYHFRGGPKTHGQSDRHRAPGSVGGTTSPGRVYKGTRMAGHMGNARATVRNVEVVQADSGRNLILIKGAVPGAVGGIVLISKKSPKKIR